MLKDLMKSIFNEEVDMDEELTEEESEETVDAVQEESVSAAEQPVKPAKPKSDDAVQESIDVYSKEEQEAIIEQIVSSADPEPAQQKQQTLGTLDADKVSRGRSRSSRRQTYRYDRRKIKSVRPARSNANAEYQNVMSPIFGNAANSQKDFKKVHNAIDLDKPLKPEMFEEVISPMFGSEIPKVKPLEKIPTRNPQTKKATTRKTTVKKEPETVELSEMIEKKAEEKPKQEKLFASKN